MSSSGHLNPNALIILAISAMVFLTVKTCYSGCSKASYYYVPTGRTIISDSSVSEKPANEFREFRESRSDREYIRGPRGGCYYINRNGNKVYVDRRFCD